MFRGLGALRNESKKRDYLLVNGLIGPVSTAEVL
jgi:hypothetical protein